MKNAKERMRWGTQRRVLGIKSQVTYFNKLFVYKVEFSSERKRGRDDRQYHSEKSRKHRNKYNTSTTKILTQVYTQKFRLGRVWLFENQLEMEREGRQGDLITDSVLYRIHLKICFLPTKSIWQMKCVHGFYCVKGSYMQARNIGRQDRHLSNLST